MFNRIIINNILGINNKVELNFIAGPKKKEKKETVIEIEPNINVNKVIGIIGPNASGKSSIIHSLLELRIFLAQYQIVETAKEKKDEKMLKYMSNRFLPERNLENLNEDSEITLEMYIPNGEIPGYYTYSLIYNNDRLNEKLFYRKKYKSKKQQLIEDFNTDTKRSDIGYKCFYKDSIIKDYETVGKQLVNKFNETIKYYNTFYQYYLGDSIYQIGVNDVDYINMQETIEFIKKNEDVIAKLLKIVDPKITGVSFENDEDGDEIIKFRTNKNVKLNIWDISTGTRRILQLVITIIKTIKNNGVMLCDEIETALHKELVQLIIQLYLKNSNYSQLIFTTHDPEILDKSEMRNEQKYYLNNSNEKVQIKKISEINSRSDYSFSKNYYTDKRFMPQPNKEEINKFCNYIMEKKINYEKCDKKEN